MEPDKLREKKEKTNRKGRELNMGATGIRKHGSVGEHEVLASLTLVPFLLGKPRSIRGSSQRANCRRGSTSLAFKWAATEGPHRLA